MASQFDEIVQPAPKSTGVLNNGASYPSTIESYDLNGHPVTLGRFGPASFFRIAEHRPRPRPDTVGPVP